MEPLISPVAIVWAAAWVIGLIIALIGLISLSMLGWAALGTGSWLYGRYAIVETPIDVYKDYVRLGHEINRRKG